MLYILESQQAQISQNQGILMVGVCVCVCFLMSVLTDPLDSPNLGPNNYFNNCINFPCTL